MINVCCAWFWAKNRFSKFFQGFPLRINHSVLRQFAWEDLLATFDSSGHGSLQLLSRCRGSEWIPVRDGQISQAMVIKSRHGIPNVRAIQKQLATPKRFLQLSVSHCWSSHVQGVQFDDSVIGCDRWWAVFTQSNWSLYPYRWMAPASTERLLL